MNELDEIEGIKVGGRNVNILRYADGTALNHRFRGKAASFSEQVDRKNYK